MTNPIDLDEHRRNADGQERERDVPTEGIPSNAVYARVGDVILQAARDGVRRNLPPGDIVREIMVNHGVHLSVGELRLLLASRRISGARPH